THGRPGRFRVLKTADGTPRAASVPASQPPGRSRCDRYDRRSESKAETEARAAKGDARPAVVAVARPVIAVSGSVVAIAARPVISVAVIARAGAPAAALLITHEPHLFDR